MCLQSTGVVTGFIQDGLTHVWHFICDKWNKWVLVWPLFLQTGLLSSRLSLYMVCSPWGSWLGRSSTASHDSKRAKDLRLLQAKAELCSIAFAIFWQSKKLTFEDSYTESMKSKKSNSVGVIQDNLISKACKEFE